MKIVAVSMSRPRPACSKKGHGTKSLPTVPRSRKNPLMRSRLSRATPEFGHPNTNFVFDP